MSAGSTLYSKYGKRARSACSTATRGLVLCLVLMIAASAFLSGDHAEAEALARTHVGVAHAHLDATAGPGQASPCDEQGRADSDGGCCISACGCNVRVPVPAVGFLHPLRSEPTAARVPSSSSPVDFQFQLRPPKLPVTA